MQEVDMAQGSLRQLDSRQQFITTLLKVSKPYPKSEADAKTQYEVRIRVILEYCAPA